LGRRDRGAGGNSGGAAHGFSDRSEEPSPNYNMLLLHSKLTASVPAHDKTVAGLEAAYGPSTAVRVEVTHEQWFRAQLRQLHASR
jgi:hypothetical protein